jgi:hypothetical protein
LTSVVNTAVASLKSASLEIERINRVREHVPGIESEEDKLAKLSKLLTLGLFDTFNPLRFRELQRSDKQFSEKRLGISVEIDENSYFRFLGEFCKGAVNALDISS